MEKKAAGCFLCHRPSTLTCPSSDLTFCGPDHQALHCTDEGCRPFRLSHRDGAGRCMVATTDIAPGDLIFREQAVSIGPFHDTPPICLTCLRRVSGRFLCNECGVPMCSSRCSEAAAHRQLECKVFAAQKTGKNKVVISDFKANNPFYQSIAALRCLLLKGKDESGWAAMQSMVDHNSDREREDPEHWKICQHNIVRYLTQLCELPYSKEEVNHVIGLLEVNAFETNLTADWKKKATDDEEEGRAEKKEEKSEETLTGGRVRERDGWGRGVFPLLAMLNHNCASNARYISLADGWMECRATISISAGEEITDHYVSPADDTQTRGAALRAGWYFSCQCARCADPREGGSLLTSYRCDGLGGPCPGIVLADFPLDLGTAYSCQQCGHKFPNRNWEVQLVVSELSGQLESAGNCMEKLEALLEKAEGVLWPLHAIMLATKRKLIYVYGKSRETSSLWHLQRKAEFCQELVSAYNLIVPGLTKERGLTMWELYLATSQQGREEGDLNLLEEAEPCLRHERPGSYEWKCWKKICWILEINSAMKALKSMQCPQK